MMAPEFLEMVNELSGAVVVLLGRMALTPGGDAYEYDGSTTHVDHLQEVNDMVRAWLNERNLLT